MQSIDLFGNYENARMVNTEEYRASHPGMTCPYDSLAQTDLAGIPIAVTRNDKGKLDVTFIPQTHLLAIGATRSGKTTGFVIPAMNIMLARKNKPSMVISDPKGELFNAYASRFEDQGYRVILLNFNDSSHSDCWNPLTKYYRLYQRYLHVDREVRVVKTAHGLRNEFEGVIYEDQKELDIALSESKSVILDEVEKGILGIAHTVIETQNSRDPFWEDSARDLLRAILYAMLEDSATGEITEDNFSFETVLHIFDSFSSAADPYDKGYFSNRDIRTSRAFQLAAKCVVEQAGNTRHGIVSAFASRVSKFRDTAVRRITCTNTFEVSELDGEVPTVIFLSFKDEESQHYEIISMFLCNLYTELIAIARRRGTTLSRPFYFLLDEFGNLPKFKDFDKVISACGGRNIWFLLVLQSYAQLSQVYGPEVSEIIRDNLNAHLFFGTNNPDTKRAFSDECGQKTVISPLSALNGSGETIQRYEKDTVPLVPVSALDRIRPCECIVTRMREDVLNAHIERSYLCPEFDAAPTDYSHYDRHIRFTDRRYVYYPEENRRPASGCGNIWNDLFGKPRKGKRAASEIDAFTSALKETEITSVPALQRHFGISYTEAHALLEQLVLRGWVTRPESGVEYPVCHDKIGFRHMTDEEIADVAKSITSDCVNALRSLAGKGIVSFAALERAVRGEEDTKEAILLLSGLGMIGQSGSGYFLQLDSDSADRLLKATGKSRRFSPFDD